MSTETQETAPTGQIYVEKNMLVLESMQWPIDREGHVKHGIHPVNNFPWYPWLSPDHTVRGYTENPRVNAGVSLSPPLSLYMHAGQAEEMSSPTAEY